MMTLEEALQRLGGRPDRVTLELYISRTWVRPVKQQQELRFEEIDIARAKLVHHLQEDLRIEQEALGIMLGLIDQVYGLREQMRRVRHAVNRQPHAVREDILTLLGKVDEDVSDV